MMEITLFTEPEKEFQLTTNSPMSHYGISALRIEGDESPTDYGPADDVSLLFPKRAKTIKPLPIGIDEIIPE